MVQYEAQAHRKDTQRCGRQRVFGEHRHGIEIAADTMLGGGNARGGRLGCPALSRKTLLLSLHRRRNGPAEARYVTCIG
jgi:hypothetical protein